MAMTQDLLDMARMAVEAALKRGAQGAQASVRRSREATIEWRDGKLDRLREATEVGLNVTLYVDGRYSANSTSDLRPEALGPFLDETIAATRVLAADPHRRLADPKRYAGRFAGDLALYDEPGAAAVSAMDRQRVARAIEQAMRALPGAAEIISVTSSAGDVLGESAMVCSNGMEASMRGTRFWIHAEASVRDQGDRKPIGWWYATARKRAKLPSVESVAEEALRRALRDRGGKPEKSDKYPCVVEAAVTSRLLGDLLGPLSGQAIQQKRSFLADKLGKKVAAGLLTITDDPWLPEGLGSTSFDGEGMSTLRRPIVERGVLKNFLLDTYYASKLGWEPTTARTSNLVFPKGKRDLLGLCKDMDRGILLTGFSGGNSNSATGDFSLGIRGHWVEGGKPVRAVSEMNLSGNALELWNRLLELGNDPYLYSTICCPSLRFDKLQFSGT
jgi:PmbA protein